MPGLLSQDAASISSHDGSVDMTNWEELGTNGSLPKIRTVIAGICVESRSNGEGLLNAGQRLRADFSMKRTMWRRPWSTQTGPENQPPLGSIG